MAKNRICLSITPKTKKLLETLRNKEINASEEFENWIIKKTNNKELIEELIIKYEQKIQELKELIKTTTKEKTTNINITNEEKATLTQMSEQIWMKPELWKTLHASFNIKYQKKIIFEEFQQLIKKVGEKWWKVTI